MRTAIVVFALLGGICSAACRHAGPPAGAATATAMGHWSKWQDLQPLIEVASAHAAKPTLDALAEASAALREGKPRTADKRLAATGDAGSRDWIAVARANIAALYFTRCIRGVAWRIEDGHKGATTERAVDFSEDARIQAGDLSVEALLTNLDGALTSSTPALVTQARIARARVTAFAHRCAPNEQVADLARTTMEADLATLAAEGNLTPDLAYLWAGVQMTRFSGAAARPFLVQAQEGGFVHPAITYMLAAIALEAEDLTQADTLASKAVQEYAAIGDEDQVAQSHWLRGQIAAAARKPKQARTYYHAALKESAVHVPSMLALAAGVRDSQGEAAAIRDLQGRLPALLGGGEALDETAARAAVANVEALVMLNDDPHLVQICRDALVAEIEAEPDATRRGIRYFFAATLDLRLREYEIARGHGALAKDEFEQSEIAAPVDVEQFLDRLSEVAGS